MAKKAKEERTAEEIIAALRELLDELEAKQGGEAEEASEEAEGEETEEATEEEGEEAAAEEDDKENVDLPDKKEIRKLTGKALKKLADNVGLAVEGKEDKFVQNYLCTLHDIANDNTEELDEKAVNLLAKALEIDKGDDKDETITKIREFIGMGEEAAEEGEEGEAEEAEGEEAAEEGEAEEAAEEEKPDYAAIAKKAKMPDKATIKKHIEAYNKVAKKKLSVDEKGYRILLEKLVGDDGKVHEWGKPYMKSDEGYCCGLVMKDIDVEEGENPAGQCLVTKAKFEFDADKGKFKPLAE
jgi:hypothetical protein